MKRAIFILLTLFICLSACNQKDNNVDSYEEEHEGIIANITKSDTGDDDDEGYRMLVISDVDIDDISEKTEDELTELAQENDGADYDVSEEMYDEDKLELNQGVKVNVYWGGDEGESNPPVRKAEKISVIPD